MRYKIIFAFFLIFTVLVSAVFPSAAFSKEKTAESLAVAGFVNLGNRDQDYINVMVTTYLTTFLSKMFKDVVDYSAVEKEGINGGFWRSQDYNALDALAIADKFGVKRCIAGYYEVLTNGKVGITLYIYDMDKKNLVLERSYRGNTGNDLFNLLDRMVKDILFQLIGSSMDLGRLKIRVTDGKARYRVFLNGNYSAEVSKDADYESHFMAGQIVELSLVKTDTGKSVYQGKIKIEKEKTAEVLYRPLGNVLAVTGKEGIIVLVNGKDAGKTDKNGELLLTDVDASLPVELEAKDGVKTVFRKKALLAESELNRVELVDDETSRLVFIPVKAGCMGWLQDLYAAVGIDLVLMKALRLNFTFGSVIYSYSDSMFGIIPFLQFNAGYIFRFNADMLLNLGAGCVVFLVGPVPVNPVVYAEFQYGKWFVQAGVRYSFDQIGGGLYPILSAGYRF